MKRRLRGVCDEPDGYWISDIRAGESLGRVHNSFRLKRTSLARVGVAFASWFAVFIFSCRGLEMSWPSIRDFDGKPILGFVFAKKLPVMRDRKEWAAFAYSKACEFVELNKECEFLAEDMVAWYDEQGYPKAHSEGCWGAIWRKMVKHGVVVKTKQRRLTQAAQEGQCRRKNGSLAIVWRAKNV